MVISDLNLKRAPLLPQETEPPLVVNADTVLSCTAPFESFEAIGRRCPQIVEHLGGIEHRQIAQCTGRQVGEPSIASSVPKLGGVFAFDAFDHSETIVSRGDTQSSVTSFIFKKHLNDLPKITVKFIERFSLRMRARETRNEANVKATIGTALYHRRVSFHGTT
jgi:hypothetical protein